MGLKVAHNDAPISLRSLQIDRDNFILRLKRQIFFQGITAESSANYSRLQLPKLALPSSFVPDIDADTQLHAGALKQTILDRALGVTEKRSRPRIHPLSRRALKWLRDSYDLKKLCTISGDKGYGPVIVSYQPIYVSDLQRTSPSFIQLDSDAFTDTVTEQMALTEMTRERYKHTIDERTKTCLLHKITPILKMTSQNDQKRELEKTVGSFRFLAKIHKNKAPCPMRKIEVDLHNPFTPVADFCCQVLGQLAAECSTVLTDSKQFLTKIYDQRYPSATTLVAGDLVNFFEK